MKHFTFRCINCGNSIIDVKYCKKCKNDYSQIYLFKCPQKLKNNICWFLPKTKCCSPNFYWECLVLKNFQKQFNFTTNQLLKKKSA